MASWLPRLSVKRALLPAAWEAEWSSMCFRRFRNIPKLYAKWPVRGLQNSLSETLIATHIFFLPYVRAPVSDAMWEGVEHAVV